MEFLQQPIKNLVQPTNNFTRITTEETLTSGLSQLASSHDAILVFDSEDSDRLVGLLRTPQQGSTTNHAQNTKIESNLTPSPRLSDETTIEQALQFMDSLNVNLLPLRNDHDGVDGVITMAAVLDQLGDDPQTLSLVSNQLQPRKPITAGMSDTVGRVAELMDEHNISRVVLTSDTGTLSGIVSRRDITDAFTQPSNRQRFSTRHGSPVSRTFDREKVSRLEEPVTSFAITKVITANDNSSISQIIKPILTGESSSVVLTDATHRPTGFISRRDILNALLALRTTDGHPIIFRHPDIDLSQPEKEQLEKIAQTWATKLAPRVPFNQITISSEVNKSGVGQVTAIETTVIVEPSSSQGNLIAKNTSRGWEEGLREAIEAINTQVDRRA